MVKPRFVPEKQEYVPYSDCEHPLCETLHRRWHKTNGRSWYCEKPVAPRIEWIIVDTETGKRASQHELSDSYCLKREAQAVINRYLEREQRNIERAVPTHLAQMLNRF